MANAQYVLAFDVGGTKLAAAVFGLDHRRLGKVQSLPAMAKQRPTVTLMNLQRVGEQVRQGLDDQFAFRGDGALRDVDDDTVERPEPCYDTAGRFGQVDLEGMEGAAFELSEHLPKSIGPKRRLPEYLRPTSHACGGTASGARGPAPGSATLSA